MPQLRRLTLPVLLAIATAASLAGALRFGRVEGVLVSGRSEALAAPILSARRDPAFLSDLIAGERLRAGLDRALAPYASSCLAVHRRGQPLYAARADLPLIPASNLKLLTATAALTKLGAGTAFTTDVRLVNGTLWLVGGGDPVLNTADFIDWERHETPERADLNTPVRTPLEDLADKIKAAGVTSVAGGVMGDDSRFDTQRYVPSWKQQYITDSEIGPLSALDVNDGFVALRPKQVPAPSPAKHAADVLASLLKARGVAITGDTGSGVAPPGPPLASVSSPTMAAIVGEMLKESDNLTAEVVTKELGRRFGGGGSTQAGVAVIKSTLAAANLPVDQYAAVDASGLDRSDRASCRALLTTLESADPAGPLVAGLPVAGRDGTLAKRMLGTPLVGRLRAKTGTLDNVASLTGLLDEPAGPPLAFSLILNGLPRQASVGRDVEDQVALVLARYPDAPPPAALGPGAP